MWYAFLRDCCLLLIDNDVDVDVVIGVSLVSLSLCFDDWGTAIVMLLLIATLVADDNYGNVMINWLIGELIIVPMDM